MFDPFAHFLSYGATDQRTLREVTDAYDGLIVPGTIAAFQSEGTKGFVLTLSAADRTPYAIDSRFPLFQSPLTQHKRSHGLLATLLGIERSLNEEGWLPPSAWTPELTSTVSSRWLQFNTGYKSGLQSKAYDKYARRLGREIPATSRPAGPTWILPPYLVTSPDYPSAAEISRNLWNSSVVEAGRMGVRSQLRQVLAATDADSLPELARATEEQQVVVWVSDLDEVLPTNAGRLAAYARAIRAISAEGKAPFALYGGYFAVTLRSVGLTGASHGVGFSEFRNHIELKSSGAAPARFYVARAHRYYPRDLASELWRRSPAFVNGQYAGYRDRDPIEYDYHELMRHSVLARRAEIERSAGFSTLDHIQDLEAQYTVLRSELSTLRLTEGLRSRAELLITQLPLWAGALRNTL